MQYFVLYFKFPVAPLLVIKNIRLMGMGGLMEYRCFIEYPETQVLSPSLRSHTILRKHCKERIRATSYKPHSNLANIVLQKFLLCIKYKANTFHDMPNIKLKPQSSQQSFKSMPLTFYTSEFLIK